MAQFNDANPLQQQEDGQAVEPRISLIPHGTAAMPQGSSSLPMMTSDDSGLRLVGDGAPSDLLATWEQRRAEARASAQRRMVDFHSGGGVCWSCRDTGFLRGDPVTGAPCEACATGQDTLTKLRADWVAEQLRMANVPQRMVEWSFASFPAARSQRARPVLAFAERWDDASGRGLMLNGGSRVGKSGLLVAAFRHVLERWADMSTDPRALREQAWGWFTTDASLLDTLRDGYADGSAREVLRRAKTTRVLIIDDLGKADYHEGHGWAAERLYEIVNTRYSELRPTWFSTNLGADQIIARLGGMGEPIMERIIDACDVMTVTGAKLRSAPLGVAQ